MNKDNKQHKLSDSKDTAIAYSECYRQSPKGVRMKNRTKSEIIIKMNHIDKANRLYLFLKKALYDGAEKEKVCIGHDVRALDVEYRIHEL